MPPRRELRSGASDITNNQELGDELVRRDGMVPPPPPPVQVGGGTGGAQQVPKFVPDRLHGSFSGGHIFAVHGSSLSVAVDCK
ncbi:hypothetical protein V6N12_009913 [Hibiscus sabdariffa]|uniref:Uncharacterized protein n=1 Tax=Hibiscus sabdariffa TaxID=183260 RepID=A0ABR2EC51_9ROSI